MNSGETMFAPWTSFTRFVARHSGDSGVRRLSCTEQLRAMAFAQFWCAVTTYVLIAIVKKELQIDASLYTLLQILSVSVSEKTQLQQAFAAIDTFPDKPISTN